MKAIVAAAGYGTRMLPITKSIPKELLPVGNKPVIQYIVEAIVGAGIDDIVMITSQGKGAIEEYFDKNYELEEILRQKNKLDKLEAINEPKFLANMCWVKQKVQYGFPHAVMQASPWVDSEYFLLTVGDTIFDPKIFQEMVALHQKTGHSVLALKGVPPQDVHKYGIAEMSEGKITRLIEKPELGETNSNLMQMGCYILPKKIFDIIGALDFANQVGEYSLPQVLTTLMQQGETIVPYVSPHPFRDTGTPDKWLQACNELIGRADFSDL